MTVAWNRILPVIVSILIIIAIAVLRNYSRTFAAIAATMPINIPLGMWIIYAGEDDPGARRMVLADFNQALLLNILPTLLFMIVAWRVTRAGWDLIPAIAAGYAMWAVGMGAVVLLRSVFGG